MAWPNFSETTFAFAFLRELELKLVGFPLLPFFLTQPEEATAGYDAEVSLNGTLHFFQFKRSEYMSRESAVEFTSGKFSLPHAYRMHLRRKNGFSQHLALQALEASGHSVFYVTSGAKDRFQLYSQFQRQTIISNAGILSPTEIQLPNFNQNHHISFISSSPYFEIFSHEGVRVTRMIPSEEAFVTLTHERRASDQLNRTRLEKFVKDAPSKLLAEIPSLLQRAAIYAQMRYDSQIVVVPD